MRGVLLSTVCAVMLLLHDSEEICGRPFFKPVLSRGDQGGNRISNGIEARMHSHPWQALLLVRFPRSYRICGGSLMHWKKENASDLVLTAAHCLIDRERRRKKKTTWGKVKRFFGSMFGRRKDLPLVSVDNVTIYLGLHEFKRPTEVSRTMNVTRIATGEFDNVTAAEDIALIKLEEEVMYSIAIQGVCLPAENEGLPPPESPCLVAGWGLLRNGRVSTRLQQLQTYIVAGEVKNPYFHENEMICTASETWNTGARQGDSGGPLVCLRNNTFVVYGVVSFSFQERCSGVTDRQAFTKVTRYLSWLKKAAAKLHRRSPKF